MLRAVTAICLESQGLEVITSRSRRDVYKLFRTARLSTGAPAPAAQTVVSNYPSTERVSDVGAPPPPPGPPPAGPAPPGPPPPAQRRPWTIAAAALALTASLGGVYFYRKMNDDDRKTLLPSEGGVEPVAAAAPAPAAYPADGAQLPRHVQYLLVGGGTASFAAMRAIRSARPDASVLIVAQEPHPPYMRPPLSKELWREPDLADLTDDALAALSFRQWNGKRRPLAYEPLAFYTPVEELAERGGAGVARGWRVARLDLAKHEAELRAAGAAPVTLTYERVLLAPGARARRLAALGAARAAGRVHSLRGARDAERLARALADPAVRRVVLVGGGFLASELSAALAERLAPQGKRVTQVFREEAPLARVLPPYLAAEAARRLRDAGVELVSAEVVDSAAEGAGGGVELRLREGEPLSASLVVECVGAEPEDELGRAAGLEAHPELGGLVVNAELQARSDVWVAGDAACFYDVALGRRRLEHHDHAVVSGRLAGENMAALKPARPYTHQSMFWSDLGPQLGYEAIGIIDSRLPTVGVFSASAVTEASEGSQRAAAARGGADGGADGGAEAAEGGAEAAEGGAEAAGGGAEAAGERRYERGVVFYTREKRVVGVLLWNLFNRMHVARQVLAQGEFDDLFEVAKLFSLHEDD